MAKSRRGLHIIGTYTNEAAAQASYNIVKNCIRLGQSEPMTVRW